MAHASRVISQRCQVSRAPRLRKFCQILFSDEVARCLDNAHRLCFGFNPISFVDIFRDYSCCVPLRNEKTKLRAAGQAAALSLSYHTAVAVGGEQVSVAVLHSAPAMIYPHLSRERQLCPAVCSVREQDMPGTATRAVGHAPPTHPWDKGLMLFLQIIVRWSEGIN